MTLTLTEVPMPKPPSLADLMAAVLTGQPQEAREALTPPRPTPQPSEAPSRPAPGRQRLKLSPAQTVQALTTGRNAMREARLYAEAWYQALRDWRTHSRGELVPRSLAPKIPPKRQMVPVVGNWGAGDVMLSSVRVETPMGWVSEAALARLCSADPLLSRVRGGGGLASLSQSGGGWHQHREQAQSYAVAVLELAVRMGDSRALGPLEVLKNPNISATVSVELPDESK